MLLRILTDNPGSTFTRNLDQKFVDTVRGLLKALRDPNVRQILMETLDDFQHTKAYDENLTLLITMWQGEKEEAFSKSGVCLSYSYLKMGQANTSCYRDHSSRCHHAVTIPLPRTSIRKITLRDITRINDCPTLLSWSVDSKKPAHRPNSWSRLL